MSAHKTLRAHFDGNQILLDDPYELEPDTKLIVTILPKDASEPEREAWLRLSKTKLEAAYVEDQADYSSDLISPITSSNKLVNICSTASL